jgi:16S rRNA (adenine1518-N6/adenine1519-N6)-dimethyltransferase
MDLTLPEFIKNLLKKYGIRPFKGWGQNFLIDRSVLRKIIESAELKKSDIVLEIGPGIGTLTQELAKKAKKVIAVEKDKKMVEILKETLKGIENVKVIQGDILKLEPKNYNLKTKNYKIVANLPYYIVSPVIRKFLELKEVRPLQMILMAQKEVAQRICAKPPNMNLLAVSVQFYSKPEILFYVSKNSFWPRPKVDGAVIKLKIKNLKLKINKDLFFKIVRAGFCQPRKQLVNNLSKMLKLDKEEVKNWLLKNGIQPNQRAETLNIEDWLKLTKNFKWKKR